MFRKSEDEKFVCGVMIDWDLASDPIQRPSLNQRTPYTALDLVAPSSVIERHLFRYDQESLFWVMLVNLCWDDSVKHTRTSQERLDDLLLAPAWLPRINEQLKFYLITSDTPFEVKKEFEPLSAILENFRACFDDGYRRRRVDRRRRRTQPVADDGFDDDTLGGGVTFETIDAILSAEPLLEYNI